MAREFAVRLDAPVAEVLDRVSEEGIAAGYPLGREYPEYEDGLLVAITERRSKDDIDRLADALGRAIAATMAPSPPSDANAPSRRGGRARERRHAPPADARETPDPAAARARDDDLRALGRRAAAPPTLPPPGVPEPPLDELIPAKLLRREGPELPEVSEPEIVRHYNRLSRRNFDLDTGPYPLGSCTMKHNPRLNERVAALPGHARLHPAQDPKRAQGALELMWRLERALAEICGLPHVSLQPSAGSHGELAGLLLTRAYHDDRGEQRHKVLTPDTAHGTNPATVTMAGYEVVKVATDERGGVDLDDLRAKADDEVACLMLTNPNTLGLFDENIAEIAAIVHDVGRHPLLRRRQPERDHGPHAARRHGLRHRPRQPPQVVQPAARRRRARAPGRSRSPTGSSRTCRCRGSSARRAQRRRAELRPRLRRSRSRSAACAASRATSASSCAPTPTSRASAATACARPPRPRC